MKRVALSFALLLFSVFSLLSQVQTTKQNFFGLLIMAGGRYDDVRMCIATPAGVKGGPIGDIMFAVKHRINDKHAFSFNLPVMRPILFGAIFKMLQLEPEAAFQMFTPINNKIDFIHGPGIGLSFHYGPDYRSDSENPSKSFFAMGPMVTYQAGLAFKGKRENSLTFKAFYTPLFANGYANGTVAGGALQYAIYF